ncbi:putative BOI-related E3 ubiquitin-protein ligase 3 [Silene latifolia]|uniref:putative BOI-related E3 ubiquitin-protein ligase 3 n=1 Tax=Silene latifolia TaxID=37657 RepID=UPI003D7754BE
MVIQANIYPQNIELPISSQDYFSMANNFLINDNNNNNNFVQHECGFNDFNSQQKLVQQQQFQRQQQLLLQQQQQQRRQQQLYMVHPPNMKRENCFVPTQLSKKTKFSATLATPTTTATTASTTTSGSDNHFTMNFSQSLSLQLEKQRQEMDRYVELQNEWLKLALQEQRKQQLGAIIRKLEVKAVQLLKQKDDEIAEAAKKTMELEEVVRKMEIENQTWQRISAQNEAMVFSLKNTLEQLQQQQQQEVCSSSSSNNVNDVESCCKVSENKNEIEETGEITTRRKMAVCKVCNTRNASVLMLPCRHMCSCKVCDDLVNACPVCKSPKMASIDALIS